MLAYLGEEAPEGNQQGPQAAQAGLHRHVPDALPVRPADLLQERPAGARTRASHAAPRPHGDALAWHGLRCGKPCLQWR